MLHAHLNDDQAKRLYAGGERVAAATTVMRSAADLYAVWRNIAGLPAFVDRLESARAIDAVRSHWVLRGPGDVSFEWEAELIRDVPDDTLAWRTTPDAAFPHAGAITFTELPHGRGTQVRLTVSYLPPGGVLGTAIGHLAGDEVRTFLRLALHRFRQLMETGEIPTTRNQPRGAEKGREESKGEKPVAAVASEAGGVA